MSSRRKTTLALVALAASAIAVAGCGSESDEDEISKTVETHLEALADGDGETACEQLNADGRAELTGEVSSPLPELNSIDCTEIVEQLSDFPGEDERKTLRDATIASVEMSDTTVTVVIEGASGRTHPRQ